MDDVYAERSHRDGYELEKDFKRTRRRNRELEKNMSSSSNDSHGIYSTSIFSPMSGENSDYQQMDNSHRRREKTSSKNKEEAYSDSSPKSAKDISHSRTKS
jgi:hypothetical protein